MRELISIGDWGHYKFYAYSDVGGGYADFLGQVTGVAAVCFDEDDHVVLMNNEPLGGHIEPGESVEQALKREALEEGGLELRRWKYFGYYKIIQNKDAPPEIKTKYPPIGYILFFIAHGSKVTEPYGKDVKNCSVVSKEALLSGKYRHPMLAIATQIYQTGL